ncbi:MAG: altronate hydrolase [Candidatus Latescibacteria bacterium]|nr:altronate hydrolase [Candidatus Latescibacterota bacterium]
MNQTFSFDQVARLPMAGDNVAIATRRLEAGTGIDYHGQQFTLSHTVMEGHRFAAEAIEPGQFLLSWELPFGVAERTLAPGDYACNQSMLDALGIRQLDFDLPQQANFVDRIEPYQLDPATFQPGAPLETHADKRTFMGYGRSGGRGVGTRNYIVVLGTSSRTGSYARLLAERWQDKPAGDGVVAVAHTEGGGWDDPNNRDLLLRTLAGFIVHPNVGAVLAVDRGSEAVTNQMLQQYMTEHGYALDHVRHRFLSLDGSFQKRLQEGDTQVAAWAQELAGEERNPHDLCHLKIALQCGGSDSFSGISGNPLAAWVARELIRYGGAANLAETDELIGAEPYVLRNVKDVETARTFLHMVERFKERVSWHGASAEGNPSGGNKFRGLYNIVLKSIGAARKRDPDVRLDYTIDYSEPLKGPGFHFMDSPGNDLESIAGQVASGCNAIFFVTGNGSITNFPFVPTIKIVTTTERYRLLAADLDVNAGAYLDGTPMDELGAELFARTLRVAGGERSLGEQAGHAQVSIWRNWQQTDTSRLATLLATPEPAGQPLPVQTETGPELSFRTLEGSRGPAIDQVGLVLPTSLCAGQIARMCTERLNNKQVGRDQGLSRFVALVHTEGCGLSSSGTTEQMHLRTIMGYAAHPLARRVLLLEHGCEKTHNDYMRNGLEDLNLNPAQFGWASVQLDGGIVKAMDNVEAWFRESLDGDQAPAPTASGLGALRLGLHASGALEDETARSFAQLTRWVVTAGGTVVVPQNAALVQHGAYLQEVLVEPSEAATLPYGQTAPESGFYIMETPTDHWVETATGLGATGVELILAHTDEDPLQGHPLVPVVQVSANPTVAALYSQDIDLVLAGAADAWAQQLANLLAQVAQGDHIPAALQQRNIDFQLTRGLLGVST